MVVKRRDDLSSYLQPSCSTGVGYDSFWRMRSTSEQQCLCGVWFSIPEDGVKGDDEFSHDGDEGTFVGLFLPCGGGRRRPLTGTWYGLRRTGRPCRARRGRTFVRRYSADGLATSRFHKRRAHPPRGRRSAFWSRRQAPAVRLIELRWRSVRFREQISVRLRG